MCNSFCPCKRLKLHSVVQYSVYRLRASPAQCSAVQRNTPAHTLAARDARSSTGTRRPAELTQPTPIQKGGHTPRRVAQGGARNQTSPVLPNNTLSNPALLSSKIPDTAMITLDACKQSNITTQRIPTTHIEKQPTLSPDIRLRHAHRGSDDSEQLC